MSCSWHGGETYERAGRANGREGAYGLAACRRPAIEKRFRVNLCDRKDFRRIEMFSYRVFKFAVAVMLVCFAAVAQASTVNILS